MNDEYIDIQVYNGDDEIRYIKYEDMINLIEKIKVKQDERDQKIEKLNKALLDIKELVVNNACLSEEDNRCVDDLIYYKCDELLDIVNKALGSDKE